MRKRLIATLMALALALATLAPALAEAGAYALEGYVVEVMEDGFVIDDKTMGEVMLNTDDTTVYDGILTDSPVEVGLYVFVSYDGRLTRSIPPQAHADKVGCYVLNGAAGDFLPEGVILTGDEAYGDVLVRFDPSLAHVYPGVPMTVYYNGIMAMSLPGQVSAAAIIVPTLEGEISAINESGDGFELMLDDGGSVLVALDGATLIGRQAEDGADGDVAGGANGDTAAVDPGIGGVADSAMDTDAEAEDGADALSDSLANADWTIDTDAKLREGYELLTPDDLRVGDRVLVYYNGEYIEDSDIQAEKEPAEGGDAAVEDGDATEGDGVEGNTADGAEASADGDTATGIAGDAPARVYALEVLALND